jgi:hypothetical protein
MVRSCPLRAAGTLSCLRRFCLSEEGAGGRVYYVHNKGSSVPLREPTQYLSSKAWRAYMEHFVIGERHRECVTALDEGGFNMCGTELRQEERVRAFLGNFW